MKIIERIDRYLGNLLEEANIEKPHFKKSESTKQTKEYVRKRLASNPSGTLTLDIFYGDKVGPATFVFQNGKLAGIKPHKGYKLGKEVVFATKD